jgi:hypothetical protein
VRKRPALARDLGEAIRRSGRDNSSGAESSECEPVAVRLLEAEEPVIGAPRTEDGRGNVYRRIDR